MTLVRYGKSEYKREQSRLIIATVGSICILTFIIFFGLPLLVNFSLIVDKLRGAGPVFQSKEIVLPPTLDPLSEATNSSALTIRGNGNPGFTLILYVNDTEAKKLTIPDSGNFTTTLIGKEGKNTISGKVLGKKDTFSEYSNIISTTIINKLPVLEVISPQDGTSVIGDENLITIEGKTEEGNMVTVNNRRIVMQSGGSFRHTVTLTEGDNLITVTATDIAGNKITIDRRVTYQK